MTNLMCLIKRLKTGAVIGALCYSGASLAGDFGLDITLATQHQTFAENSADLSSLSLSPYYAFGGWEFSATLSYAYMEGTYFRNSVRPFAEDFCARLLGLTERQQQFLIRRGRLTQEQLLACEEVQQDTGEQSLYASGAGDASLFARYAFELDRQQKWLGFVGLGYGHDNGDYEEGLGKGSQDTQVRAGLVYTPGAASLSLIAGYDFVNPTDSLDEIEDYGHLLLSVDYTFTEIFSLGAEYLYEQSYFAGLEDVETLGLLADLSLGEQWRLGLTARHYLNEEEFSPENEFSLTIHCSLP